MALRSISTGTITADGAGDGAAALLLKGAAPFRILRVDTTVTADSTLDVAVTGDEDATTVYSDTGLSAGGSFYVRAAASDTAGDAFAEAVGADIVLLSRDVNVVVENATENDEVEVTIVYETAGDRRF